jgi:hypothetical protein
MQVAFSLYALAVLAVLWVGFAIAQSGNRELPTQAWEWLRSLPAVPQIVVWILILPLAVGLWAWHSDLGQGPRIVVALGLVAWTILALSQLIQGIRGPA